MLMTRLYQGHHKSATGDEKESWNFFKRRKQVENGYLTTSSLYLPQNSDANF